MNQKAFEKYLATGEYVPTEDAAPKKRTTLAVHDKRFHPNGFDPKRGRCQFREAMAKGDKSDAALMAAEKKEICIISHHSHPRVAKKQLLHGGHAHAAPLGDLGEGGSLAHIWVSFPFFYTIIIHWIRHVKENVKNVKNHVNILQKRKRTVGCFYYILAAYIMGSIEKTICPWKAVDIVLCAM